MIPTQEAAVQVCLQANRNVHLWGMDGEGKTEWFKALVRELGWGIGVQILSQCDPTDEAGLPVIVGDRVLRIPARIYREACEYGERGVPFVVFKDEKNTAAPATLAAGLNAETQREAGDIKLPDSTRWASAANPPEIAVNACDFQPPTCTRMTHVNWTLDFTTWAEGMINDFQPPVLIPCPDDWRDSIPAMRAFFVSYIQRDRSAYREEPGPQFLNKPRGNPRTWEQLATVMACGTAMNVSEDVLLCLAEGTVGKGAAQSMWEYWMLRDLVDIDEILGSPDSVALPTRNDVQYILSTGLAAEVCRRSSLDAWIAYWIIMDRAVQAGWKDIAALGARAVAKQTTVIPKAAKNIHPVTREFVPMLKALKGLSDE